MLPQAAPEPDADDFDFEEEAQGVVTPQRRAPGTKKILQSFHIYFLHKNC